MVIRHQVEGYENFWALMKSLDPKGQKVHIYFGGTKLPNGTSWCSDCNRAAPVVEQILPKAPPESFFITCLVGDRSYWKDPKNPFRRDPKLRLMVVPTIIRWGGPQRLTGEQCEKPELLEMLFTDEEEAAD